MESEITIKKTSHAKSEIDVALDVINILLSQNRPGVLAKDAVLPLPAGSLHATYVARPRPTNKAQLESVQLTLGLKRKVNIQMKFRRTKEGRGKQTKEHFTKTFN